MNKQTKIIFFFIFLIVELVVFLFFLSVNRTRIINETLDNFDACMIFERERKGEQHCINYVKKVSLNKEGHTVPLFSNLISK